MKELFRATVMLAILVGLPAAWIYYGPLPPEAQKVVDRVVEVVKDATGWQQPYDDLQAEKSAPRYAQAPPAYAPTAPQTVAAPVVQPAAITPGETAQPTHLPEPSLDQQLAPLLGQLQQLGPSGYSLHAWGNEGQYYRFCCEMPVAGESGFAQHFEAVAESPGASIQQVTAEIAQWKRQREGGSPSVRMASQGVARR